MADTTTLNYSFVQPEIGASTDTWGGKLNTNWASVDTALKAVSTKADANETAIGALDFSATAISYDPTTSGLAATDVQAAIDEVNAKEIAIASTAEAQAGTDNEKAITPLRMREGLNAAGTAPVYACRAWVNFNGDGTVAIRASGNVSSIADEGVGNYRVNLTTALEDANYCVVLATKNGNNDSPANVPNDHARPISTSQFGVYTHSGSTNAMDVAVVMAAVFR